MSKFTESSVSVLMPVYNGEAYLREAIESILLQSYENWELIVANDGSTDASESIAAEFAALDPRVRLMTLPHRGLVSTLNEGVKLCTGRYIFRMDADDIALPKRLELQTQYLDSHPAIAVLGCVVTSASRIPPSFLVPASPLECRWQLVFRNCLGHPGVAIRASALLALPPYRAEYFLAEDFKLWSDLSQEGDVHVLNEVLLFYRKHANSVSRKNSHDQIKVDRRIVAENIQTHVGVDVSEHLNLPPAQWACEVVYAVASSSFYRASSPCERAALYRGLEIYIARYGVGPLLRLMWRTGFRDSFKRPLLIVTNLARSFKARALKEG